MTKQLSFVLNFALISTIILQGCGGKTPEKAPEKTEVKETTKEPVAPEKDPVKEEESLEPAKVTCQIIFQGDDITEEDGSITKGTSYDVVDSKTNMSYTFCYDSESYKNFKLSGTGKELSFVVKDGNRTIFKKEGFELKDKMTFSIKDFSFYMGSKYTIELRQKETVLFKGKIEGEGCM